MSLRDDFFNVQEQPHKDIEIEGWGKIRLRRMSSGQWLDIFGVDGVEAAGKRAADTTARLIVAVVYDPATDKPVFTADDIEAIKAIPGERLTALLTVVSAMKDMPVQGDFLSAAKKKSRRTRGSGSSRNSASSSEKPSLKLIASESR